MMTGFRNLLWLLPLVSLLSWPFWGKLVIGFLTPPGSFDSHTAAKGKKKLAQAESFTMNQVFFNQLTNGNRDWQIKTNRLFTAQNPDKMQMEIGGLDGGLAVGGKYP